ncbi:restriction endonuclease subunit S [Clostridium perfringens]|uniref:restriction endonuclease subunit S n=1 Tax=Clostridium perfringens TaxID=1502 RepID=UPI0018E3FB0D|nr:restriction endonuclease subunit S [Clostridium perfringens]MBI6074838.1 restriction endonuclease subunit S [Clostridium perfringens]MDK0814001.1 restriction endonuclease subunit S [Clostridium perfringens]
MSRNVPKLRFKGFEDEWRKGKLGDMSKIIMGQSPSSNAYNYNKEGLPLVQGNADITKRITTPRMYTTEITKTCEIEDIIMSVRAPVGSIAIAKQRSCIGRGVCSIKAIGINQKYLYQVLLGYEKKWLKISQGSTFESINSNDIKGVMLNIPSLQEQEKIANFLSKVDSIIEKQEKKVQYWNSYKKGMMQKIFSQKIRFKDENGRDYPKWESKRFKEILIEPKKEKVENPSKMELLTVKLHCKGVEKTGKYPNETKGGRPYYIRNEGELLIGRQNMHNGGIGLVKNECDGNIASNAISSFIIKNSDKGNIKYIYLFLSNSNFYKRIDLLIGGTGQKEISKSELDNLKIEIPLLEEQNKIVKLFSNVDNIIEKESKKLEELKQWKKGLLQQLFV